MHATHVNMVVSVEMSSTGFAANVPQTLVGQTALGMSMSVSRYGHARTTFCVTIHMGAMTVSASLVRRKTLLSMKYSDRSYFL